MSTDKRNSAIFINGGAGRVIASIPALEKFQEENPDDDFVIVCEGGTDFFKGHQSLYARVYDHWHKGLFQDKLKENNIKYQCTNNQIGKMQTMVIGKYSDNIEIQREVAAALCSLSSVEDNKVESGTVLQEIQAGYMFGDRLLRPALVAVAKKTIQKDDKNKEKKD